MDEAAYNPKEMEQRTRDFWESASMPAKTIAHRVGNRKFYFLDGPPYATGSIHMGTALNKILKDFYIRFFRMRGYDVWCQPGYDTHGMPIENKVEKQLGLKRKPDIEAFGIEKFNRECRAFATKHIDVMNAQFANLGVWMTWDKPYLTLSNGYIEGAWHTFKTAYEKGLLYKGNYPVHVCPRCETAVAYNEIEYFKAEDPSIYVKFRLRDNASLVIWTTTPWTLPANTGIMVHPDVEYAKVRAGADALIIAKDLVGQVMKKSKIEKYDVVETFPGSVLNGLEYTHPLSDALPLQQKITHRVVTSAQFVTLVDGTGLVHVAPGHGTEDSRVGREFGLAAPSPIGLNGLLTKDAGMFAGMFAKDADKAIIAELGKRGALLFAGSVAHDYPKCWRCDSPLLQMSVPQWFFRITSIRDRLLQENATVNWVPEWAKKRFDGWLKALGDWPISRQRYWGIPLPIWVCGKCGGVKVVGSADELPSAPDDLHRPYIDAVALDCGCGGVMRRIPDVLDVWFDSGVASWASLGYPRDRAAFDAMWPAQLNIEGPDQFRGWWNSEIITGVITFDRKPFENVLLHGMVLDLRGSKMSKSRGNVITPEAVVEKYGRDALRLYLLSSPAWDDFFFSIDDVKGSLRLLNILWNVGRFALQYCRRVQEQPALNVEDAWIISRVNSLVKSCTDANGNYRCHEAVTAITEFISNDLSRWYVKLVRDRTWPAYGGRDKDAACYALYYVLDRLVPMLAPVCPFICEEMFRQIGTGGAESVHMLDWPKPEEGMISSRLEETMEDVKAVVDSVNSARQEAGIKLRWPVRSVVVTGMPELKELGGVIMKICNAKSVAFGGKPAGRFIERKLPKGAAYLDVEPDAELEEEKWVRELVRAVQVLRKEKKLDVRESILLQLDAGEKAKKVIDKWKDGIAADVGASSVSFAKLDKPFASVKFGESDVGVSFRRV